MTYFTPQIASEKKMKHEPSGPRAETLMMIRYYARVCQFLPDPKCKPGKFLLN